MVKSIRKKPRKTKPRRSKPKPRRSKPRKTKPRRSKPKPRRSKPKPRRSKPRKTTMFSSRGISLRGEGGDDRKKVIQWLKNNKLFRNLYDKQLGLPPMPKFEDSYEAKKLRASTGKHNSAKHEAKAFAMKMKNKLEKKFGVRRVKPVDLLVCLFEYMISIAVYVLAGATGYRRTFDEKRLTELATQVATPFAEKFTNRTNKSIKFIPFINREYPNGWPIKPEPAPTSNSNSQLAAGADLVQIASIFT